MMILLVSMSTHKSGATLQLTRTIEQERAIPLAQAGINEMLALTKDTINNPESQIGSQIKQFWLGKPKISRPTVLYSQEFAPGDLKLANQLFAKNLGNRGDISGNLSLVVYENLPGSRPSYLGYLELVGTAKYRDLAAEIKVKERREVKIVSLADPFVDKYALFVKSFCKSINNPKKRIIIQGVKTDDPTRYSFIYLGNRSYPACPEFPQGHKSANVPPVLLDLDFREDKNLLGPFYQPGTFQMISSQHSQASAGNFFFVNPPFDFAGIAGLFSVATDFHHTPELVTIYKSIVDSSRQYADTEGSLGYVIAKDFQKSGGNPANSEVFRSLVQSLMQNWKYHYGYSDFTSVTGAAGGQAFTNEHPFSGIISYFEEISKSNPQRTLGGKMPLLFGDNRDTPVYIEGPVFLRFFKIALVDQTNVKFNLHGGYSLDVPFPPVPMHYEKGEQSFSGKKLQKPVDNRTGKLMSEPVEHLSINNFFFGAGSTVARSPTAVRGGIEGHDIFPAFDESLKSVSHMYQTADEFIKDRVHSIEGQKVLCLDGISLIMGAAGQSLDLSAISIYQGKGKIVIAEGNCLLGNIGPLNHRNDSLGIYLMEGRFKISSDVSPVQIKASLIATTCFSDNSSAAAQSEGGIEFEGKSVEITGNLIIDNLFELRKLPDGGYLKINHDPELYFADYPVRTSIGSTKSLMAVDYNAE